MPQPVLAETIARLGPFELTRSQVDGIAAGAAKIVLIVVLSAVAVRLVNGLIDRAVVSVRERDNGPIDRLKHRTTPADEERRADSITHARRVRRAEAMSSVGRSMVAAVVWTLALFSILATVNIDLAPYIAGLGIVGVALGFGAQDLVADFISGVFMLLEDQYGIGDIIDSGEAIGVVEGISLRTTRIRSVDGALWYVPNGEIRRLGNMSQQWARALLDIGVAYDTDIDHATRVIERVATAMAEEEEFRDLFLDTPEVWGVENLGADSIDIRLVIQTTPGDQYAVGRQLRRRLKRAFDEEGIEIPFQQRTLWIRDATGTEFPGPEGGPAAPTPEATGTGVDPTARD